MNIGVGYEGGFDFTGFDTKTPDLYLMIQTTGKL